LFVTLHEILLVSAAELEDVAYYLVTYLAVDTQVKHNSNQILVVACLAKASEILLVELFALFPDEISLNLMKDCIK
jgi:hypothetical protein